MSHILIIPRLELCTDYWWLNVGDSLPTYYPLSPHPLPSVPTLTTLYPTLTTLCPHTYYPLSPHSLPSFPHSLPSVPTLTTLSPHTGTLTPHFLPHYTWEVRLLVPCQNCPHIPSHREALWYKATHVCVCVGVRVCVCAFVIITICNLFKIVIYCSALRIFEFLKKNNFCNFVFLWGNNDLEYTCSVCHNQQLFSNFYFFTTFRDIRQHSSYRTNNTICIKV